MSQSRIRATFIRGGTSKALVLRREDLPDQAQWDGIFLQLMGSPDPNGRQLDGMGGGVSSLSKVCIIGPSQRPDADVDYTFAQVSIRDAKVDYSGNCGNMSSAVGPFAIDEGMVAAPPTGEAVVRIHNTNTGKIIVSRFPVEGGKLATYGDMEVDGISGSAAPIRLEFVDPAGSKSGKLLPSGAACDVVEIEELGPVRISGVDAANPCVFAHAEDLGKEGNELPDALEADPVFLKRMEMIRRLGSIKMGLAPNMEAAAAMQSVPRVAIVFSPRSAVTLSGRQLKAEDADIGVRMISMGQPHRAVPVTGAICLAVAARIPGSIPHSVNKAANGPIRIAQPSGITKVDAAVTPARDGKGDPQVEYGALYRTSRRLFEGFAFYRSYPAIA